MNNVLYEACRLSEEEWINSFFPLEEHVFSARHERKMKAMFSKIRNNKYHKLTKNAVRAIIIAAIILSLAITAFAIEIAKAYKAYNMQIGTFYTASNRYDADLDESLNVEYIPNGFKIVKDIKLTKGTLIEYKSENGEKIIIEKYVSNNEAILNTEIGPYEEILHDNIKYIFYTYNNFNCIIWIDGKYSYNINSNLSKDDLLLVAFSTK